LSALQGAIPDVCKLTTTAQQSSEESGTTWKRGSTMRELRKRFKKSTVAGNDQCQWRWQQSRRQ